MSSTPYCNDPAMVGVIQHPKIDWDWIAELAEKAEECNEDCEWNCARELEDYKEGLHYCFIEGNYEKPGVRLDLNQEWIDNTGIGAIIGFSIRSDVAAHLMWLQGAVTAPNSAAVSPEQVIEWVWNNQELCAFVEWAETFYEHSDRFCKEAVELFTWPQKLRDTAIVFLEDGMDFVEALVAAEEVLS